ncbi:MAG: M48 family metallopeptidase [Campylobacteraceae bacterium]|nr:M48 family metallopeptidase [Campylobacteraceae bacterium]
MKYEAKLPKKNVNISHQKPLSELLTLLTGVLVLMFIVYKILDFSIDYGVKYISPKLEKKLFSNLGDAMFDNLGKNDKLQGILENLSECANLPYILQSKIQNDKQSNAFAYPGGYVIIYSNLIKNSKSQNSLAFVLAHEIGHFKNRDHLRAISKNTLLSALVSLMTNSNMDSILIPVKNFLQMKYSREHESQADEIALDILNCYYGHVGGADEFFKNIQKEENNTIFLNYFSTHPQTQKRIDALHNLAIKKGYKFKQTLPMWKTEY